MYLIYIHAWGDKIRIHKDTCRFYLQRNPLGTIRGEWYDGKGTLEDTLAWADKVGPNVAACPFCCKGAPTAKEAKLCPRCRDRDEHLPNDFKCAFEGYPRLFTLDNLNCGTMIELLRLTLPEDYVGPRHFPGSLRPQGVFYMRPDELKLHGFDIGGCGVAVTKKGFLMLTWADDHANTISDAFVVYIGLRVPLTLGLAEEILSGTEE